MFARTLLLLGALLPFAVQAGPVIQHWETANGARVYFLPAPELPMVDVQVTFDAGSARDGAKGGSASLTAALLSQGAKFGDQELSADEIAERFEALGAAFGGGAERDSTSASLRSLTDPDLLNPAVEVITALLSQPTFPQAAFDRERSRMLLGLQQQLESPDSIADKTLFQEVFGAHPYAQDPLGTTESVTALTRQDLSDFHKRYYVGKNAVVAIVGAVDRSGAEALAEQIAGGLPPGEPAAALPKVATLEDGNTISIHHPSAQTHILMGQPGMNRHDPDYFALLVGNHILGGSGLISRLSHEIREQRGLSYSTYSYFAPLQVKGPYILGLQTRNEQAELALDVLRATVQTYVEQGPTAAELKAAKDNITGGFALRLDSNAKLIGNLSNIGFYHLPLDYLDTYIGKVEAVTLAQIQDAFQRRVNPEHMVTVIVGGAAQPVAQQ